MERNTPQKLYRLEVLVMQTQPYEDLPINELRKLAAVVWKNETNRTRERGPIVVAGKGWDGSSYCRGRTYIELMRNQRCRWVLLHEMTHAIGFRHHNRAFVLRYFELLEKYGGYDREHLLTAAALMRLKL